MRSRRSAADIRAGDEQRAAAAAREAKAEARAAEERRLSRPVLDDLAAAGFEVRSIYDLANRTGSADPQTYPVLLEHLDRDGYPDRVRESMVRVMFDRRAAAHWDRLVELYRRARGPEERMALASVLSRCARRDNRADVLALLRDHALGESRVLLVRAAIRVGGPEGRALVESLVDDPVFGREATATLARREGRGGR